MFLSRLGLCSIRTTAVQRFPRVFGRVRAKPRLEESDAIRESVNSLYQCHESDWTPVYAKPIEPLIQRPKENTPSTLSLESIKEALIEECGAERISVYGVEPAFGIESTSMIIVEMDSSRGRLAVGEMLIQKFKRFFAQHQIRREGLGQDSDWAVIDLGGVMVHLMSPEARKEYGLEEAWKRDRTEISDSEVLAAQMKPKSFSQDPVKLARLQDEAEQLGQ